MLKRLLPLVALVLAIPVLPAAASEIEILFPHPVGSTEFTDSFGAARSGHYHQGNDLMAPKMTEVYAVADGTVVWIRDGGSAGRYVTLDHGDGWESWYMHLNDDTPGTDDGSAPLELGVVVEVGEEVEAEQLIGYVGDSGNAEWSSSHTHFELHHGGSPIDPYPYLMDAFESALEKMRATQVLGVRLR